MKSLIHTTVICLTVFGLTGAAFAGIKGGRYLEEGDGFSAHVLFGQLQSLEGTVEETKRAYTETPGILEDYARYLENYSLEELGFDESYPSYGFSLEQQWTYLTFQLEATYAKADAEGTPEREPFAIGVNEVTFEGETYEYMLIPEGQPYTADFDTYTFNARALITPFYIQPVPDLVFSPWLHLGLFGGYSSYTIDAGPAQLVTTYEHHPYDYVVGGTGEGDGFVGVPELGLGGELRFLLGSEEHPVDLIFQGSYAVLDWEGSTDSLGVSARNEKNVDLSYETYELRALLEFPISEKSDLVLGVMFRHTETDAEIEALRRPEEEQLDRVEKYDKTVTFTSDFLYGMAGIRF